MESKLVSKSAKLNFRYYARLSTSEASYSSFTAPCTVDVRIKLLAFANSDSLLRSCLP